MGGALTSVVTPSSELSMIVGTSPLTRAEVTRRVWSYIREHNLQDPVNKRMINADDNLRVIFGGRDQVSMFEMTAMVSKHLKA